MATELATAYIQLLPSFRGLRAEVSKGLADAIPAAKQAGARAGDSFADGFRSSKDVKVGDKIGSDTSSARQAGAKSGDAAAQGFEGALGAVDASGALSRSVEGQQAGIRAAGSDAGSALGLGVTSGLAEAAVGIGAGFGRFSDEFAEAGVGLGGSLGEGTASGVAESLASRGTEIAASLQSAVTAVPGAFLAAGAAAGLLVAKGIGDALQQGGLEAQFEASLGVSESAAAALGQRTGELYSQNFGTSIDQTGEAVARAQRAFDGLSAGELDEVAKSALTTASVFDQDLNQSINAASQLLRTDLVGSSTEAFDLITVGLQGTANKSDDFLDTLNEYSTLFRDLGLTGSDALNLITQGVNAGARDSDIAADALKEFSIRAVDGSALTAQGFETIGLSAKETAAAIASGGDGSRAALQDTLEGLRAIEDPALRSQVAVSLFGTQAEDLGDALFALDLNSTVADLERVPGAAADAQAAFDDLQSNIEILKRSVFTENASIFNNFLAVPAAAARSDKSFESVGRAAGDSFIQGFKLTPFGALSGTIEQIIDLLPGGGDDSGGKALGQAIGEGAKGATGELDEVQRAATEAGVSSRVAADGANALSAALSRTGTAGQFATVGVDAAAAAADAYLASVENATRADDLLSAGLRSGSAIRGLLEGGGFAESETERKQRLRDVAVETDRVATEQQKAERSTEGLSSALRRLDPALSATAIGFAASASAASAFGESIENSSFLDDQIESSLGLADAYDQFSKTFRRLPAEVATGSAVLDQKLRPKQREAIRNTLALGEATQGYLQSLIASGRGTQYVRSEADKLRARYAEQFRQLGLNEAQVNSYLEALGLTPEQVETAIKVSGVEEARSKLQAYVSLLDGKIPGTLASSVIARVESGDVEGASDLLANFAATNPIDVPVTVSIDQQAITTAQDALDELERQALELPSSFDPVTAAFGGYTDAQTRGLEALLSAGESAQAVIAGFIEDGNIPEATRLAGEFEEEFRTILGTFGVTEQAAQDYYLQLLGLDGLTVNTAIEQAGVEEALSTLGLYSEILKNLGSFTLQDQFKIADLLEAGDIEGAKALIESEVAEGRGLVFDVGANTEPAKTALNDLRTREALVRTDVPFGANTQPADDNLTNWRFGLATGLPFIGPFTVDPAPALGILEDFQNSLDKAKPFLINLAVDVDKFIENFASDLGIGIAGAEVLLRDLIPGFAGGGLIQGPGGPRDDGVLMRGSAGEYVIQAQRVRQFGVDFFDKINKGQVPGYVMGGMVDSVPVPAISGGSGVSVDYKVVEARSNPSPEDLVRVVGSAQFLGRVR